MNEIDDVKSFMEDENINHEDKDSLKTKVEQAGIEPAEQRVGNLKVISAFGGGTNEMVGEMAERINTEITSEVTTLIAQVSARENTVTIEFEVHIRGVDVQAVERINDIGEEVINEAGLTYDGGRGSDDRANFIAR